MEVTSLFSGAPWPAANGLARWGRAKARPYISFASNEATRSVLEWASKPQAIRPKTLRRASPAWFKSGNYVDSLRARWTRAAIRSISSLQ